MYCIKCGTQIPDNSKFCSHCGKPQNEVEPFKKENIAEIINENKIDRQVFEENRTGLDYQFLRKSMGWYLAWVLLHLGILLIFSDSNSYSIYNFVPFSEGSEIEDYDIREFLVYSIFPLAILLIWGMVRTKSNTQSNEVKPD